MTRHSPIRRRVTNWIRDAFTANIGLKILSMVLALGLVAYQRSGQGEQERTVLVNVNVLPPPEEMNRELMRPVPPHVSVTVRGTARALEQLTAGLEPIELDLRSGDKRTVSFEPSMLSLPPGVKAKVIEPPKINLEWQPVVVRDVPIQVAVTGQIADGYTVDNTSVDPAVIPVKGPAAVVEVLQFVRLAAFDVSGKTEGVYRHRLALDSAPQQLKYLAPASAMVTVTIARQLSQRRFIRREVSLVGIPKAEIEPGSVDVTVIGPPDVVNGLREEMILPRVELDPGYALSREHKHGSLILPVKVELGRATCEVQPPSVKVSW